MLFHRLVINGSIFYIPEDINLLSLNICLIKTIDVLQHNPIVMVESFSFFSEG